MALTIQGVSSFAIDRPVEWSRNQFGLDRLMETWSGPYNALDSFLSGMTLGAASSTDGNMFRVDIDSDAHKQYPSVRLTYAGKKGGTLPPDKNASGRGVQQARYSSATGKTSVEIVYNAYFTSKTIWSRSSIDLGAVGPISPADADVFWFVAVSTEGATLPTTNAEALAFFVQRNVTTGPNEEVVSGQYYTATATEQAMLFSIGL